MKKLLLLSIFLSCACLTTFAQIAEGGCSSVTVVDPGSYPEVWGSNGYKECGSVAPNDECCILLYQPYLKQPKYQLQKKSGSSWTNQGSPIYQELGQNSFTGLGDGIYRVQVIDPSPNKCLDDLGNVIEPVIDAYNYSGVYLGNYGFYNYSSLNQYTNEVLVGETDFTDKNISFLDYNGDLGQFVYDEGDQIDISTFLCKDYNRYFLAIFESGSQSRYESTGWVDAQLPHPYDLTNFWLPNSFIDGNTYELQLVIGNKECPTSPNPMWTDTDEFSICPFGTGCRFVNENTITMFPVPATSEINIEQDIESGALTYAIYTLDGKILVHNSLNGNRINISNFNRGTYLVQILSDKDVLKTQKVVFI